jgi:uncharacterized damage-inducible protein DinB
MSTAQTEPWLRGTHSDLMAVSRAVVHALELAEEDLKKWCGDLSDAEIFSRPFGLGSVAFQIRHIAGSMDRLLTYAEGNQLSEGQLTELRSEDRNEGSRRELFEGLGRAMLRSKERVRNLADESAKLEEARNVGRKNLPTTVGGLLVHVADHTQRHVGQAIVTAKILVAQRALKAP